MNANTTEVMLSFLTGKEAAHLARTNKFYRNQVQKNACQVLAHCTLFENAEPGKKWADQKWCHEHIHFTRTKAQAVELFETYKKDPKCFRVVIYHYEAPIDWCANRPEWTVEWNR